MTAQTSIHAIADEVLTVQATLDPLNATMLGIRGHDHQLADVTEPAEWELRRCANSLAERAEHLTPALTGDGAVTAAVAAQQARAVVDRIDARMIEYSITDFTYVGPAANLLSLMPTTPLGDADHVGSYLARLSAIPAYLEAVAERHRAGATAGRVPVGRLVDAAVAHLDRYLADQAADPLRRPVPPASAPTFAATRDRLLDRAVRPAFAFYRDVLAGEIRAHGRPDQRPGLGWLPDGEAMYAALMRVHTTTEHTPNNCTSPGWTSSTPSGPSSPMPAGAPSAPPTRRRSSAGWPYCVGGMPTSYSPAPKPRSRGPKPRCPNGSGCCPDGDAGCCPYRPERRRGRHSRTTTSPPWTGFVPVSTTPTPIESRSATGTCPK